MPPDEDVADLDLATSNRHRFAQCDHGIRGCEPLIDGLEKTLDQAIASKLKANMTERNGQKINAWPFTRQIEEHPLSFGKFALQRHPAGVLYQLEIGMIKTLWSFRAWWFDY